MKGAEALVETLKQYKIETIFTVPGVQLDNLFDVFYDYQDDFRLIHCRHEQATAYMAFGFAQSTGKVGTNMIVPGPGLLNAGAGLATAHACSAPILCLAGQIPSKSIGKGTGMLHELDDQPGAVASVTKWAGRANEPSEAPSVIRDAFIQLNSGRRQPVLFEMSPDIMSKRGQVELINPIADFAEYEIDIDETLMEEAAVLLGSAKNPAIFSGGGVFGAEEPLLALAKELQAPVIMSQNGQGAVDQRNYLGQNQIAGQEMWKNFDVILAVGTRFHPPMLMWEEYQDKKLIRIGLEEYGDPDLLSHTLLHSYPLHVAKQFKIPLCLLGENSAFEYGGKKKLATSREITRDWFDSYAANKGMTAKVISEKYSIPFKNLWQYDFPDEIQKNKKIKAIFCSAYFSWDSNDHLNIAKKYGFKELDSPSEGTYRKFVGIDELINRLHQYIKVLKFGYGRATDHACEDIRLKKISRAEAKELIKDTDLLKDYSKNVL